MITIHKYVVKNEIQMPVGAEILKFDSINNELFIWAKVETLNSMEKRCFRILGTGREIPCFYRYIGSIQHKEDIHTFIWHLFEVNGEIND